MAMLPPTAAALTADGAAWKQRYRTPTYTCSGVATANPRRGVVSTNKDGVGQIYAWDRATGAMHVKTDSPAGKGGGVPSRDGRCIYYHKDLNGPGSEIGHYVAVEWDEGSGPRDEVSLTPALSPYAAAGLAESRDGSTMALCVAADGGQTIYTMAGGGSGSGGGGGGGGGSGSGSEIVESTSNSLGHSQAWTLTASKCSSTPR